MDWHVLQRYQETTFCLEILDHSLNQAVGTVEYSAARHTANVAYARDPDAALSMGTSDTFAALPLNLLRISTSEVP